MKALLMLTIVLGASVAFAASDYVRIVERRFVDPLSPEAALADAQAWCGTGAVQFLGAQTYKEYNDDDDHSEFADSKVSFVYAPPVERTAYVYRCTYHLSQAELREEKEQERKQLRAFELEEKKFRAGFAAREAERAQEERRRQEESNARDQERSKQENLNGLCFDNLMKNLKLLRNLEVREAQLCKEKFIGYRSVLRCTFSRSRDVQNAKDLLQAFDEKGGLESCFAFQEELTDQIRKAVVSRRKHIKEMETSQKNISGMLQRVWK